MDRHLDTIFRLLRENFVGPIRTAIQSLLVDMRGPRRKQLSEVGGFWRTGDSGSAVNLHVYGQIQFDSVAVLKRDLVVQISVKAPKNLRPSVEVNKKLQKGGLVGLLVREGDGNSDEQIKVFLGEVMEDVTWSSGDANTRRGAVKVAFHDATVFTTALNLVDRNRRAASKNKTPTDTLSPLLFFEVPGVLPGTINPFLERLQSLEPSSIPLGQYIAGTTDASTPIPAMQPPRFARSPTFRYQLRKFLLPDSGVTDLTMVTDSPISVENARRTLKAHSHFDPSQADAFVDGMTRELAMIQGPPGTGKSWIGVQQVKALLYNNVKPIFVLAYTNHALDQFLHMIYNEVTTQVIRCGGRSKDPTIAALNLFELSKDASGTQRPSIRQDIRDEQDKLKEIRTELGQLCNVASIASANEVEYSDICQYLFKAYPTHAVALQNPPYTLLCAYDQDAAEGWVVKGQEQRPSPRNQPFKWWINGWDFDLLNRHLFEASGAANFQPNPGPTTTVLATNGGTVRPTVEELSESDGSSDASSESDTQPEWIEDLIADPPASPVQETLVEVVEAGDTGDAPPSEDEDDPQATHVAPLQNWFEPTTDRPLSQLLELQTFWEIWSTSVVERRRLMEHWVRHILDHEVPKLERLQRSYREASDRLSALYGQAQLEVLKGAKVIGATTNGAAKLLPLLGAAAPRVAIVEEAGECLESHILCNLVPSIEQLILIGDPLQLRPHVENYALSLDSSSGKLYRLDESLFERLVNAKLPYSLLHTQRRMRSTISHLIRKPLYPQLEDHDVVKAYPDLKGFAHNVFFWSHSNPQDNQHRESASKTNTQEAMMTVDIVVHLINQGYQPGDIAVLSPYLGQVKILKRMLASSRLEVELDERDVDELNRLAEETGEDVEDLTPPKYETRTADRLVTLRSVDNFQGEEAKVVILSLVRNVGSGNEDEHVPVFLSKAARASIGFMKSANRTNVALSRAKHGLLILGNAELFRQQSSMWQSVISTLEEEMAVGDALPLRCEQHPEEEATLVNGPGLIPQLSPQGEFQESCLAGRRH